MRTKVWGLKEQRLSPLLQSLEEEPPSLHGVGLLRERLTERSKTECPHHFSEALNMQYAYLEPCPEQIGCAYNL